MFQPFHRYSNQCLGYKFPDMKAEKHTARRTAWGGEIYNGVTALEPSEFFNLKRESVHTNATLIKLNQYFTQKQNRINPNFLQ